MPNLGRHSLATTDRAEALSALAQLDRVKAEDLGLAPRSCRSDDQSAPLLLAEGRKLYENYIARPLSTGGVMPSTRRRYRTVFDKFLEFAAAKNISAWNAVTKETLYAYATHLQARGYAHKSQINELTVLKQAIKVLVELGHLKGTTPIIMKLKKAESQPAYCWRPDEVLGKGIVWAKDTPNFIANRIGTFSVLNVMRLMQEMDLSIEDVDALTGDAVGWPKSATFRTIDLVGLDILGHVVGNMEKSGGQENPPHPSPLPDFYKQMLERKWLGDKTKVGFYKKSVGRAPSPADSGQEPGKEEERLALDWKSLAYRPRQKPKFPALDMAKNIEDPAARLRMLLGLAIDPPRGAPVASPE
jgi:hypothetical protein